MENRKKSASIIVRNRTKRFKNFLKSSTKQQPLSPEVAKAVENYQKIDPSFKPVKD